MEKDVTIMTPVPTENSPDANGRYGLLTCNETCSIKLQFKIHICKEGGGRELHPNYSI